MRFFLLDLAYVCAAVAYLPVLVYRMAVQKKSRRGWAQRFGWVPGRADDDAAPLIWIHCVSLGETNLIRVLVDQIRTGEPKLRIAISTTTDSGQTRARELFGSFASVFYFPLDFSPAVGLALRRLRPNLIVLAELEVWPNLLALADARNVPVVVINGRISDRAWPKYRRLSAALRASFRRLTAVAAQDQAIAERFIALGTPRDRVGVLGTMKFDTAAALPSEDQVRQLGTVLGLQGDCAPLLVCGQTGPGDRQHADEELVALAAYRLLRQRFPSLRVAIAPRKPERFDEVARLIEREGFAVRRRSQPGSAVGLQADGSPAPVILLDTIGQLRALYAHATVVFVGRTLVPLGGSDVLEVAALAKPMVVGPYTQNFADPVRLLRSANAVVQLDSAADPAPALAEAVGQLLTDLPAAQAMGERARAVVAQQQGSTDRHLAMLMETLHAAASEPRP